MDTAFKIHFLKANFALYYLCMHKSNANPFMPDSYNTT